MIPGGPRPVAPFSHAVESDGFVFVTGQMPDTPAAPGVLPEGIAAQTRNVMANLATVLAGVGLGLESRRDLVVRPAAQGERFQARARSLERPGQFVQRREKVRGMDIVALAPERNVQRDSGFRSACKHALSVAHRVSIGTAFIV